MGLFNFFKKKETSPDTTEKSTLLAMPMFNDSERYVVADVLEDLKNYWGVLITDFTGDDNSAVFKINDELVILTYLPAQIPWDEISRTAQYAYNWQTAEEDLKNHNGHAIVSVISTQKSQVESYSILSKLLSSILSTSNAIGVYHGSQTLLIPKSQYLEKSSNLLQKKSPVHLWIYIGIRTSNEGNSIYTYGLNEFGKQDIEVINSQLEIEELYGFISNIAAYVIDSNITFKSGETLGYTAEQKIKITSSAGILVEGNTLKLEM
ncbi:hypothetical protein L1276_002419 [Flavobacterium sp. HSC-32F16]|uniref:DUF4261 domain-containing protein n=1 Tax=Flavobacterium sp. HSC-32F16 TaxID=2910964 RepID=UPI0020A421ED|nr:DUF4261 domain-containing protein [Flavobacterium sp. HSC-32F16]MCP2027262.1 hypothetical protein [Flavobacterium sp. HSC-32F16]